MFDFDNDGLLDVLLIQNGGPRESQSTNRLFRQGKDGKFTDVSTGSGLDVNGYGMGVAIADVNNDGFPDVFLTEYGRVRLFLNNGDGKTFTDITRGSGTGSRAVGHLCFVPRFRPRRLARFSSFVSYVDYDPSRPCVRVRENGKRRDYCHPSVYNGTLPKLYRNCGKLTGPDAPAHGVRFEDVTLRSGLCNPEFRSWSGRRVC